MSRHSKGCEKFDAVQHHYDFSHPFLRFCSLHSLGAANDRQSLAKKTPTCVFDVTTPITLPGFEVSGGSGLDNLRGPLAKDLAPCAPTPRRSGSTEDAYPAPRRREHRTHAANCRSRVQRLCVCGRPAGPVGSVLGRVLTPHTAFVLTVFKIK